MIESEVNYKGLTNAEQDWVIDGSAGIVKLLEVAAPSGTASGTGILYVKSSDSKLYYQDDGGTETEIGAGSGAPTDAQYVVLAANGSLSAERILTGTSNQIVIVDSGAGAAVTLSTPQNLHPTASIQFGTVTIGSSNGTVQFNTGFLTAPRTVSFQDSSGSVYIMGGIDVRVVDGGTGASSASDARTNLGLAIGTDIQAFDAQLSDIAGLTPTGSTFIVGDGSNFVSRTAAQVRGDLTLVVGTDVQAYDAQLADIAGLTPTASTFIVGNGSNFVSRSAANVRGDLTLVVGTDVQAFDADLTTIAGLTQSASAFIVSNGTDWTAHGTTNVRKFLDLSTSSIGVLVYDPSTSMSSGTAKAYFTIPPEYSGMNLTAAYARLYGTAASTAVIIDVNKNATTMFTTRLFIDAAEAGSNTSATAVVINTAQDDVVTNDLIDIDIDQANAATKGLFVRLTFQQP